MTYLTRLLLVPLLVAAGLTLPARAAVAADAIPRPHDDAFYADPAGMAAAKPGAVLRTRAVTAKIVSTIPVNATQVLYRTQDELGRPSSTVTTVIAPVGAISGVVSYLSFYDALGDICSPSYTLRGGDAGTADNNQQAQIESGLIASLIAQGYAVTVPDFEGKDLHWVAGHESGWNTLDAVRATESLLGLPATTKVGLFGYSGGSIGGEWAAELAPSYAPELTIAGTAIGGIPVDLAHNLNYVNGSKTWSGVIPAAVVALGRAFDTDLSRYLSPYGAKVTRAVSDQCIGSFNGAYPGLTVQQLVKPAYADFLHIPVITRIVNRLIMGSVPGHPTSPMFMAVGNADGIGDNVMIVKDTQALAHEYCSQGVKVNLQVVDKADHTTAALAFFAQALPWLGARMAGLPMIGNCSSIPAGSSLAPIALKRLSISPTLTVTNRGQRHDVLRVSAGADAAGATARFYRLKGKRKVLLRTATLDAQGQAKRVVRDRNGRARTRYLVIVAQGRDTVAGSTKWVAHR
ncbi:lipase family protein [Nocardioides sp.]|uniref:lipase family protein n=1 Tax=Nocardioides sp. TaxID=35761 RepID=UPI00262322F0|nr:lipase family protein [Nocardioides sp.]